MIIWKCFPKSINLTSLTHSLPSFPFLISNKVTRSPSPAIPAHPQGIYACACPPFYFSQKLFTSSCRPVSSLFDLWKSFCCILMVAPPLANTNWGVRGAWVVKPEGIVRLVPWLGIFWMISWSAMADPWADQFNLSFSLEFTNSRKVFLLLLDSSGAQERKKT